MKPSKNVALVAALMGAVAVVLVVKKSQEPSATAEPVASASAPAQPAMSAPAALPRLVDLGADKCVPCKMMAPILEELKKSHEGRLQVDFIDVWKNPDAGQQYALRVIPTQIFIGPDGKELARHEGFMSREDILGQGAKLGISFDQQGAP